MDRVGYLNSARGRKAFRNKVGGAIAVGGRVGLMTTLSQISMFLTDARMIMTAPLVHSLAVFKRRRNKDTRGIKEARELGKSMVQIAKATASLRGA